MYCIAFLDKGHYLFLFHIREEWFILIGQYMVMWYSLTYIKMSRGHYHQIMPRAIPHNYGRFRFYNKMNIIVAYVFGIMDNLTALDIAYNFDNILTCGSGHFQHFRQYHCPEGNQFIMIMPFMCRMIAPLKEWAV